MKILIDAHLSENKITGIGRYLNCLIKEILNIDKKNKYIILLNNQINQKHPLNNITSPNVTKKTVMLKGPSLQQNLTISSIVRKYKPDVYHHPHFDLPFLIHIPSVITVHDLKYIKHAEFFSKKQKIKSMYIKLMLQSAVKRASKVIAVSEHTKNDLIDLYRIQAEKIDVIYHGYKKFNQNENEKGILNKSKIKKPYILFVGERRPHKNIENLIYAFHKLTKKECNDLQLVIVGKKYTHYKKPEQLIDRLKLKDKIILTDSITDAELVQLYKNSELFILPSFYEGFGMPILEAMSFGVPVLGSNTTSIPEIISKAGLLFNPHNIDEIKKNMEKVLKNRKIRNTLIEKGKKRVKEFSWDSAASQTLEVYRQVAAANK